MLVEGAPLPVWVRAPTRYAKPGHRRPHAEMVDCLAYWLWQFTPSLPDLAAPSRSRVIVDVEVEDPDLWVSETVPAASGEVASTQVLADGVLQMTVHASLMSELDRADNLGERALVRSLLLGLDAMLDADVRLGKDGVDAAIERHAPLGPKKKISLLSLDAEPALIGGNLPRYRRISPADTDHILDEAGDRITERFAPPVGPIAGERRVEVLNDVVAFHFEQLKREVAVLSAPGLLEYLISMHEAVVRDEALERRTLGARMATFGETGLIEERRRSLPEATQSAIALRFLVEYVCAQPPRGLRRISLDVYDRLVAICGQIVSRGMTSDIIHARSSKPTWWPGWSGQSSACATPSRSSRSTRARTTPRRLPVSGTTSCGRGASIEVCRTSGAHSFDVQAAQRTSWSGVFVTRSRPAGSCSS